MMSFPWWLSLSVGFLSLSQEILWVRVVSFSYQGAPIAFSFVLGNYLVGIALGAFVGKWFCRRSKDLYLVGAATLMVAAAMDLLTPALAGYFLSPGHPSLPWVPMLIILTAALKSVLFPIAHHLGSAQSGANVGRSVSKVYFGNIIGSTLGPIVTGFYLLDNFTVEQSFMILGTACALLGVATAAKSSQRLGWVFVGGAGAVVMMVLTPWRPPDLIGPIALHAPAKSTELTHVIQNKHGIIHVVKDAERGDVVFGGNIYDGRTNVDMTINSNGLDRVYLLAALHPAPRRVLVIGMSTGAWTRALTAFPGVEHIDVVEINPGYLDLVRAYPEVSPLLEDPRVHVHIDDGRRWLKRHPDAKYDLIVQNTTYHWRSNITNLLSVEYFGELRGHMRPGGIATINTTASPDVYRTAQAAFPHAFKYRHFVYVGDRDFGVDAETVLDRLRLLQLDGRPVFEASQFEKGGLVSALAANNLVPVSALLAERRGVPVEVITDQNLLTEYRHGRSLLPGPLQQFLPGNPDTLAFESPLVGSASASTSP